MTEALGASTDSEREIVIVSSSVVERLRDRDHCKLFAISACEAVNDRVSEGRVSVRFGVGEAELD